jgi:hypothetical protein
MKRMAELILPIGGQKSPHPPVSERNTMEPELPEMPEMPEMPEPQCRQ